MRESRAVSLERVWEPFAIRDVEFRNRIVRSAHATGYGDQDITDGLIAYHVARARAGVAMSVIEAVGVHRSAPFGIPLQEERILPGYARLVSACQAEGMKVFQQLYHIGPHGPAIGSPAWASSYVPGAAPGLLSHAVTQDEIDDVVESFSTAAGRCVEAGVDGIEIHCAHGYLIHSFLSEATNLRTDGYGGSFENRMRFGREIIAAVRAATGPGFVVGIRLSTEDGVELGTGAEEAARIARALTEDGSTDYVSLSCGNTGYQSGRVFAPAIAPHRYEMPYSRVVTAAVDVPTMVAGRFMNLEDAEEVLAAGDADLVAMVRAMIADPELLTKTRAGNARRIRPCIGCNQACVGGIMGPTHLLECTVNPAAGHELDRSDEAIVAASVPRDVVVVGGGPAGLEAARVAALAGHEVSLLEREDALGGQLRYAGANPVRSETALAIGYWEAELEALGVGVQLGVEADATTISKLGAEVAILATGSRPRRDGFQSMRPRYEIPGFSSDRVLTSWDVLGGAETGETVAFYDDVGHFEAIDVAEYLVSQGRKVTYITRNVGLGARSDGGDFPWEALVQPHLAYLMKEPSFRIFPRSFISEIRAGRVEITHQDAPTRTDVVAAETVVMVSGNRPARELVADLEQTDVELHVIGDAVHGPTFLQAAVRGGNLVARSLVTAA